MSRNHYDDLVTEGLCGVLAAKDSEPDGPAVCLVYANFCGHCKDLHPKFRAFAGLVARDVRVLVLEQDGMKSLPFVRRWGVQGFPTFMVCAGAGRPWAEWEDCPRGPRNSADDMAASLRKMLARARAGSEREGYSTAYAGPMFSTHFDRSSMATERYAAAAAAEVSAGCADARRLLKAQQDAADRACAAPVPPGGGGYGQPGQVGPMVAGKSVAATAQVSMGKPAAAASARAQVPIPSLPSPGKLRRQAKLAKAVASKKKSAAPKEHYSDNCSYRGEICCSSRAKCNKDYIDSIWGERGGRH